MGDLCGSQLFFWGGGLVGANKNEIGLKMSKLTKNSDFFFDQKMSK